MKQTLIILFFKRIIWPPLFKTQSVAIWEVGSSNLVPSKIFNQLISSTTDICQQLHWLFDCPVIFVDKGINKSKDGFPGCKIIGWHQDLNPRSLRLITNSYLLYVKMSICFEQFKGFICLFDQFLPFCRWSQNMLEKGL